MSTLTSKIKLVDVPYIEDQDVYEFFLFTHNALKNLQIQVEDLSSRIDTEGVVTNYTNDGWYAKLPGSYVIQSVSKDETSLSWQFPVKFIDDTYSVVASSVGGTATVNTKTSKAVAVTGTGTNVSVVAFGRWQ